MLKPRYLLCVVLFFVAGCGPTAKQPYEPPEDLPMTDTEDGEGKLPEDSGP